MQYVRVARRCLTPKGVAPAVGTMARQRRAFASAQGLVRVYYGATLYILVEHLHLWSGWVVVTELTPLWPVAWVTLTGMPTAVPIIMTVFLLAALVSTLVPEYRVVRALCWVSMFEFAALYYSVGGRPIMAGMAGWRWASVSSSCPMGRGSTCKARGYNASAI